MDHKKNHNDEIWDLKAEEYNLQLDAPNDIWNNVSENDEDLSYVFNETSQTTPAKSCGDLGYQVTGNESINKEMEHCRDASSQSKRRRMLHFDDEVLPLCDEDFSSSFFKSKETEDSLDDAFDMAQWVSGFTDDMSTSGYDGLEQYSENWMAECLVNDSGMQLSPDDMSMNLSGTSDIQMNLSDSSNSQPESRSNVVQERTPTRNNVIFKGKKSLIKTPTQMNSSVILPFAFVKPCGVQGAVTIKDINKKILTPPPSKSKKKYEDPVIAYPTSAFSGKPIVGQTKIRTEGGKGSITIMRTKG